MKRNGIKLADLGDGHKRRMADGKNAFRKMSPEQRHAFLTWIIDAEASGEISGWRRDGTSVVDFSVRRDV